MPTLYLLAKPRLDSQFTVHTTLSDPLEQRKARANKIVFRPSFEENILIFIS